MRGAVAAQELGCLAPYVDAVFAALWEDARNMDDLDTIRATLESAGFDADALVEKSQDPAVKARLQANTQSAWERGAFGSPTFFVSAEMFFGKDRLGAVEDQIILGLHGAAPSAPAQFMPRE